MVTDGQGVGRAGCPSVRTVYQPMHCYVSPLGAYQGLTLRRVLASSPSGPVPYRLATSCSLNPRVPPPLLPSARLGALHVGLHQELRMLVVRQRLYDELTELAALTPRSALAPPLSAKGTTRTAGTGARQRSAVCLAQGEKSSCFPYTSVLKRRA